MSETHQTPDYEPFMALRQLKISPPSRDGEKVAALVNDIETATGKTIAEMAYNKTDDGTSFQVRVVFERRPKRQARW